MQRAQSLIRVLRQLADLVEEEARRNASFAEKLDGILAPLPKRTGQGAAYDGGTGEVFVLPLSGRSVNP